MTKLEKVIKALECCKDMNKLNCDDCPYTYNARSDRCECTAEMAFDALELLKEQEAPKTTIRQHGGMIEVITEPVVKQEWVSVKDRLPEELEAVNIVWVNHDPPSYFQHTKNKPFAATAVYYKGNWYWWNATVEDVLAEYGRSDFDFIDKSIEITHWMPLPEPPKEGDKENGKA